MRIGLNALLCSSGRNYRRTGVSRYIDELVRHLARSRGRRRTRRLCQQACRARGLGWSPAAASGRAESKSRRCELPGRCAGLPIATRRDQAGSLSRDRQYHSCRTPRSPALVTVHDLAFLKFPGPVTAKRYQYLRRMIRSSVRRADLVLVPSSATRADVIETFEVDPGTGDRDSAWRRTRFRPAVARGDHR